MAAGQQYGSGFGGRVRTAGLVGVAQVPEANCDQADDDEGIVKALLLLPISSMMHI